jgi:hypothetical protein
MLCPLIQDVIPGERGKIALFAADVAIPLILELLVVQMPVDMHEEPAELRGMHGDRRQDRAHELHRALDWTRVKYGR